MRTQRGCGRKDAKGVMPILGDIYTDGRWDKNDTKDAANIADLISRGRCQFYDLAEGDIRELRSLLAYRTKLKKQEHALRMYGWRGRSKVVKLLNS
jgi:hypothetical protein